MGVRWWVAWSTSTPRKPTWTSTSDIERVNECKAARFRRAELVASPLQEYRAGPALS